MLGYIIDCVIFFTFISSNEYGNFFHPEDTIKQQDNIRTQKKVLYQIGFKLHVSV